jgi:hypothetical protein
VADGDQRTDALSQDVETAGALRRSPAVRRWWQEVAQNASR